MLEVRAGVRWGGGGGRRCGETVNMRSYGRGRGGRDRGVTLEFCVDSPNRERNPRK